MLFKALSAAVYGIDATLIDVEVDLSGVAAEKDVFHTVGLSDAALCESRDRVRAAIKNSGYTIPPTFMTINLAPADLKKEGSGFDLPIVLGILGAYGALRVDNIDRFLLVGELGLDGSVRPVPNMLPVAILAREKNIPTPSFPPQTLPKRPSSKASMSIPSLLSSMSSTCSTPQLWARSCNSSLSTSKMCAASKPPSALSNLPPQAVTTSS